MNPLVQSSFVAKALVTQRQWTLLVEELSIEIIVYNIRSRDSQEIQNIPIVQ